MKNISKITFLLISFFFFTNILYSQDEFNFNQRKVQDLSEQEILNIKKQMEVSNTSMDVLEYKLTQKGLSKSDFQILKNRLGTVQIPQVTNLNIEIPEVKQLPNNPIEIKNEIFGSSMFTNPTLTFEPNSDMATPLNYVLGAGDELQILIYGIQEFFATATISKEGKISISNVGQINVNGMTYEAASTLIKMKCKNVFSTLKSGQSNISITLTKIRTIKVTIIGVSKPGNYSLSSLSTVFNALYVAGGPNENGSFRNIELIRNNKIYKTIDIYNFIMTGDQNDNINLKDNDVIRVPAYNCRVTIEGEVKNKGIYELKNTENFNDLLKYCSGFNSNAYLSTIKLVQKTDKELKIIDLSKNEYEKYKPKSGDVFSVGTILNKFENKISIKGAVYRPDNYSLTEGLTISSLINKADGLTEDAYKQNAQITRTKEDFTKEIISIDLTKILNRDSIQDIKLKKDDEIYIFSILDFTDLKTVEIQGQIRKPGVYAFIENLTLFDLIIQAGGFSMYASKRIEISKAIKKDDINKNQQEVSKIITLEITNIDIEKAKTIILDPFDKVQVRKMPIFETQKSINISGFVEFPGEYNIGNKEERFLDLINRAGGLKSDANLGGIYIKRNDYIIPVNFEKIVNKPKSNQNIKVQPGDELVIQKYVPAIRIIGSVASNTEIPYVKGKSVRYYIKRAGGFTEKSDEKKINNQYPNRITRATKRYFFINDHAKVLPGTIITIPEKAVKEKIELKEFVAISSMVTGMVTMVAVIANQFK